MNLSLDKEAVYFIGLPIGPRASLYGSTGGVTQNTNKIICITKKS
jgi:hypothetical protein